MKPSQRSSCLLSQSSTRWLISSGLKSQSQLIKCKFDIHICIVYYQASFDTILATKPPPIHLNLFLWHFFVSLMGVYFSSSVRYFTRIRPSVIASWQLSLPVKSIITLEHLRNHWHMPSEQVSYIELLSPPVEFHSLEHTHTCKQKVSSNNLLWEALSQINSVAQFLHHCSARRHNITSDQFL